MVFIETLCNFETLTHLIYLLDYLYHLQRLRPVVSQAKEARAPVCLRLMQVRREIMQRLKLLCSLITFIAFQNPQILQAAAGMEKV